MSAGRRAGHHDQDKTVFVEEGSYLFRCGDEERALGPGDAIFLPRGISHAFRQTSPVGCLLFSFAPAGDMEAFFTGLAQVEGPPDPGVDAALFAAHGMMVAGPPIDHG